MRSTFLLLVIVLCTSITCDAEENPTLRKNEILSIVNINENNWQSFIYDAQIFENRVDTITKIRFWKQVINTSDNWVILNQARNRKILNMISKDTWDQLSDDEKEKYRDFLRQEYCLDSEERIFATTGKAEFYQFKKAMPSIDRGIEVFMENEVDPWYAQSILLIESPGQLVKSPVGAMGSFQLMSKVARKFGLRVDSQVDERKDFDRSAYGASMLIKTICLPYAREMMADRGVKDYSETDLWFRLLVLHVYHAGAYNVKNALAKIDHEKKGMDMIYQLWQTESKGFKNASQNYTQVVLASMLQLDEHIHQDCIIYHSTSVEVAFMKEFPEGSSYNDVAEKL